MASNIPSEGYWSVKIVPLPASITNDQLARTFNLPTSRINIPKVQRNATYIAWINGFIDEEDAKDFANQWTGASVLNTTIRCNAVAPKNDDKHVQHATSNLPKHGVKPHQERTASDKQFDSHSSSTFKENSSIFSSSNTPVSLMNLDTTGLHTERMSSNQHQNQTPQQVKPNPVLRPPQTPGKL